MLPAFRFQAPNEAKPPSGVGQRNIQSPDGPDGAPRFEAESGGVYLRHGVKTGRTRTGELTMDHPLATESPTGSSEQIPHGATSAVARR